MLTIPLHGQKAAGRVALIDDQDFGLISQYRWTVSETLTAGPYAATNLRGGRRAARAILMHQMLTGYPLTDHRDGDGLNNQRSNLRWASRGQNLMNSRKRTGTTTSTYKGVYLHRPGWWRAKIKLQGNAVYLGTFRDEVAAARAYDAAARELFGEFARPNFP